MSNPTVCIRTNYGAITAELYPDKAPMTVANFLQYVKKGFYDNTLFHRTIPNFMIQGGGLERGMYLKATDEPIQNEAANGMKNKKFTLAMARLPAPHSASSQFFVNVADNNFLDYKAPTDEEFGYCVFGKVIGGAEVVTTISDVKTGERSGYGDVPELDVVIETVEIGDSEGDNSGGQ